MMSSVKNVIRATFIISLLTLSSCLNGSKPNTKELENMISAAIPAFTTLEKTQFDFINLSSDKLKANFQATVEAKEDLFIEVEDSNLDTLVIDRVHKKGKKFEVYGYVLGLQKDKEWNLLIPQFESGLEQLGSPQSEFYPTTIVKDSNAYTEALQEEELKRQEIAKLEEKRQQAKQRRIEGAKAVFKKGRVFSGQLISDRYSQSQPIRLEIAAVVGSTYIVECSNPEQEGISQIFEGKLEDQIGQQPQSFVSLSLKPRSPQQMGQDIWYFYQWNGSLILTPTDLGIDGKADMNYSWNRLNYRIVVRN